MDERFELNDRELEKVIGGLEISNPVSGLTEEEARRIASELGAGTDMGSWRTMSGEQFLKWWQSSRDQNDDVGGICG